MISIGIIESLSWEANFGDGAIDYFFFPWGLILLTIGAWVVYNSKTIDGKRSSSNDPAVIELAAQITQRNARRHLLISGAVSILFLVLLTVVVNVPFISANTPGCPEDGLHEDSIMTYYFPCNVVCNFSPDSGAFGFFSNNLTAGAFATNSSSASAALSFEISNPCAATPYFIFSLTFSGWNISNVSRWDSNAQPASTGNAVVFQSRTPGSPNELIPGKVTHFVFYPASTISESIVKGDSYSYEVEIGLQNSTSGFGATSTAT